MAYLVVGKEVKDYRVFRFTDRITVGRAETNDVVLSDRDDLLVSRRHADICKEREGYVLRDRSKNGTWVEGRRIDSCLLVHGTKFEIVDYEITFVDEGAVADVSHRRQKGGSRTDGGWEEGVDTLAPSGVEDDASSRLKARLREDGVVVVSEKMTGLYRDVETVARIAVPILILGEAGTGKEHVARTLHAYSGRTGRMVAINCSSIPGGLFESELFGCVKGAFNNAVDKAGKLEMAEGGTCFLDEVGDMSLESQPKLLRFIEDQEITRLGDTKTRRVDVRLIAATNQDLKGMIRRSVFRKDFYERLACIRLELPPLRERKEEIPVLMDHFLEQFSQTYGWRVPGISKSAREILEAYDWPGNIRELRNLLLAVSALVKGERITSKDLKAVTEELGQAPTTRAAPGVRPIAEVEAGHIREALRETGGNKARASRLLGISRDTLYKKMKKYGIGKAGGM